MWRLLSRIKKRGVEQRNFDDYLIALLGDAGHRDPFRVLRRQKVSANREPRRIANAILASARERVRSLSLTSASLGGARSRGKPAPIADRWGVDFAGE